MLTDRELKKGPPPLCLCPPLSPPVSSLSLLALPSPRTEIRKLDSNLKTLVYENYNKFISATDTIKKVPLRCPLPVY